MKFAVCVILAAAAVLTGCNTNSLFSLEPFATDGEAVFDARLVGTWARADKEKDDPDMIVIVSNEEKTEYSVMYLDGKIMHSLNATLFKTDDAMILDVTPSDDDNFSIPAHVPVRVWIEGNELKWAFLDSGWLRGHAGRQLTQRAVGKRMLLASSGQAVHDFVTKYAADEQTHGDIATYRKLH